MGAFERAVEVPSEQEAQMSDQRAAIKARATEMKRQGHGETAVEAMLFSEFVTETLAPAAVEVIMKIIVQEAREWAQNR